MEKEKKRCKHYHNRKAEYYLMSVKQRNEKEFRECLKKERRRHAEDKVHQLYPLGPNDLHSQLSEDVAEIFYLINSFNHPDSGGTFYLRKIKKLITEEIEKYYVEMELPMPDLYDFLDQKAKQFNDGL
tara:strand:- start:3 stop:386 length:384 start_codon:yes stop_codon:yes gene_type:complete